MGEKKSLPHVLVSARVSMTVHVCLQCLDCTSAALAATKILKKLAKQGSDADEAESMRELATHYEKHAIGEKNTGRRCGRA